jgi:hypothetical protein
MCFPAYLLSMGKTSKKPKLIDVYASAKELAEIFYSEPSFVEKELLAKGESLIGIFQDPTFKDDFKNFQEMKIEALKMAIEDMAMGAVTLRNSTVGLTHTQGKIQTYITPIGTPPPGNTMYSINLKSSVAFKNFRFDDGDEFPQEDVNASIYYLSFVLSDLLFADLPQRR